MYVLIRYHISNLKCTYHILILPTKGEISYAPPGVGPVFLTAVRHFVARCEQRITKEPLCFSLRRATARKRHEPSKPIQCKSESHVTFRKAAAAREAPRHVIRIQPLIDSNSTQRLLRFVVRRNGVYTVRDGQPDDLIASSTPAPRHNGRRVPSSSRQVLSSARHAGSVKTRIGTDIASVGWPIRN